MFYYSRVCKFPKTSTAIIIFHGRFFFVRAPPTAVQSEQCVRGGKFTWLSMRYVTSRENKSIMILVGADLFPLVHRMLSCSGRTLREMRAKKAMRVFAEMANILTHWLKIFVCVCARFLSTPELLVACTT